VADPPSQLQDPEDFAPWLRERAAARLKQQQNSRKRAAIITLCVAAAVVFGAVWNPPTGSVHSFSAASDYKASTESGCTNSGKGCHGSDPSRTDFNIYHKGAKCTDCHDFQGVACIPCHTPSGNECQLCHDGSVKGAPDTIRLTDPYPRGHYRETSHTAMGTDYTQAVHGSAGGQAKATCGDCHAKDLRGAHAGVAPAKGSSYGATIGCGGCHNDTRSSGQAVVLAKWKGRRCEDCHGKSSSAPMHGTSAAPVAKATGKAACGSTGPGCHQSPDLHATHPDKPAKCSGSAAKGEPACHSLTAEAAIPTATACGVGQPACHGGYRSNAFRHKRDAAVHSPSSDSAAADTSYYGVACGRCHHMAADGHSLNTEHALWTSAKTNVPDSVCRDCHNDPASQQAIVEKWLGRDGSHPCWDCHGTGSLPRDHPADIASTHSASSAGCAPSGPGCHPTDDLSQVGKPTTTANIHSTCLRCHDAQSSGDNLAYDPSKKTCGAGRDCHGQMDEYDPATSVHDGNLGRIDGRDPYHAAGKAQANAQMTDPATGARLACDACHQLTLGGEHTRPNADIATGASTVCVRCHDASAVTAQAVKGGWPESGTSGACAACHGRDGAPAPHTRIGDVHGGTELAPDGTPQAGACVTSSCHDSTDLRVVHSRMGCLLSGCHQPTGDIDGSGLKSCGGLDRGTSCHVGYSARSGHKDMTALHQGIELNAAGARSPGSCVRTGCHASKDLTKLHRKSGCQIVGCHGGGAVPTVKSCGGTAGDVSCHHGFTADQHFVDHGANLSGKVGSITYGPGENRGCFGCHLTDLRSEHSTGTSGPSIAGGGATNCRVCHYDPDDPGTGQYAGLAAVKNAIANRDKRCVACHASGSDANGPTAAASPHQRITATNPLPAGSVWSDPRDDWKAAAAAPTGGGHNLAWAGIDARPFPATGYSVDGTSFTWAMTPNSGVTAWLFRGGTSLDAVRANTVTCEDCHVLPDMAGPHGSAVKVAIDPAYSQTEYANPTRGSTSEFNASGTARVVCFKCHSIAAGSVDGTDAPGGNYVHATHAAHLDYPAGNPERYGDKCIDCHVRIPHAWRHQRLLIRTITTTDGVPADAYPYVQSGHDGLAGVLLTSFTETGVPPRDCVTGGCHGRHSSRSHPSRSDVPTAGLWP
jgi:hypothetical protein